MSVISYKDLKGYLNGIDDRQYAPVYLLFGEELLYKTAFNELLDTMIPPSTRGLNYEPVEGANEHIPEAIQQVNTYSLVNEKKVVAICDSKIFYSKQDTGKIIGKIKEDCDNKNFKKAAKQFLSLLGVLNVSLEDAIETDGKKMLISGDRITGNEKWLDDLIDYCRDNGLRVPGSADNSKVLELAIEKQFPTQNHLIITTDLVDKRRTLYKAINKIGMVIDCSVPKGNRRADQVAQEAVLRERAQELLKKYGKTIDNAAYPHLFELTGFELRTFSGNIEKLIDYTGDRKRITIQDIRAVLKRTKQDPIYNFSNAITDRNLDDALFFMNSLLAGHDIGHPLQLLAAITNQVRKLLLVKGFTESSLGKTWFSGCQFRDFEKKVLPAVIQYDENLSGRLKDWDRMLTDEIAAGAGKTKKKKKQASDLLIVKNRKNAYPVFQVMKKSEQFTKRGLVDILEKLCMADQKLKSTGQNSKIILEETIIYICHGQNRKV